MMADTFEWHVDSPDAHGLNSNGLETLWENLEARGTNTFLVVRHDKIVFEKYADGWDADKKHYTASLAKALVGGTSLMLAMDDQYISQDDFAHRYIPQWKAHPEKAQITIRHLATHTSGVEDARDDSAHVSHDALQGWKGEFWKGRSTESLHNSFTISRDEAPVIFTPGTKYHYSNPGMALLSYATTAALRNSPHKDVRTLLRERVMRPIGVPDSAWSIGYGKTFDVEGLPIVANWGGGGFTARAVASVGRLMLHRGEWDGVQLISPAIVEQAIAYSGMPLPDRPPGNPQPGSGMGWWLNFDSVWPSVPPDAFGGAGAGNQILLVIPSLDIIIVRNGAQLGDESKGEGFWGGLETYLFNPLMACVTPRAPYPQSSVITKLTWEPASQVRRLSRDGVRKDGSDNWPMTWADDDNQYTAYGDGYGFEPGVKSKLGLGFGVVMGDAENFVGLNIRSDAENSGYGSNGEKASGILMVDGVLYLWVRNADRQGNHSRLGWSLDYGKTWKWCDWDLEEFGYPTFINYGKNYGGARDDFVYIVSHDNPSAYESADRFILMRAPKDQLQVRSSYEFFVRKDENSNPVWSGDVEARGGIFTHPGYCGRSSISYNAPLKRYLWWQGLRRSGDDVRGRDKVDTRFEGGFGVFDAPQPWGPWTTVYFTDKWDIGPGEAGCFPTKWMSEDGKTIYLVFSGDDNFAVRKATLTLGNSTHRE